MRTVGTCVAIVLAVAGCASSGETEPARLAVDERGLPEGVPAEFPIPEGVEVTDSFDGQTFTKLILESEDDPSDVLARYQQALADAGWRVTGEYENAGTPADIAGATLVSFEGHGRTGTLIVGKGASAPTGVNATFMSGR